MDKEQIIEKLKAGHELYNRGTGWWLNAPKRAGCAADAVKVNDDLMNALSSHAKFIVNSLPKPSIRD
jgi:hypothetical protein